jgi:AcrR family transcriptional regulator
MSREARGAQLLDVAETLFAERGFEGTSMEDIARTAGVTRPMVYAHHPTKDAVFVACVRRARDELEAGIREPEIMIEAGAGIDAVVERAGEVFFGLLERDPRRWTVLFNPGTALAPELAEELATMRRGTIARLQQMVRHFSAGEAGGEHDDERDAAFAHAISGAGEQLGRWWIANPDIPKPRVIALYRDFITGGLASRLPPSAPGRAATVAQGPA